MPRGDRGGKSKGSGIRCVAANCGNTNADGVSLHTFPKDARLRKKWADFVKMKRGAWPGPTEYSALCSTHFASGCFPFRQRFEMEQMGIKPKKITLNHDAVPTIHATVTTPAISSTATSNFFKSIFIVKITSTLNMCIPCLYIYLQRINPYMYFNIQKTP